MENILKYPKLFEPIVLGGTVFRNRIFASPQGNYNVGPDCYPSPDSVAFFERKARGGFASVCMGDCIVDGKTGTHYPFLIRIDEPNCVTGLGRYASAISRLGAVASVELSHAGIYAAAVAAKGDPVYGPVEMEGQYGHVLEMPESEILRIIDCYAKAAAFAKSAGCGMVTIHGGHGWMLSQFWSRKLNTRKDKWGGESLENRMRFSVEVVKAIRRAVGKNFPIEYRMSGSECYEDGYTLEEGIEFARGLDGLVDLLHVSAGHHQIPDASAITHPSMFLEDGCNAYLAREIKKHVSTPVATVGAFTDPAQMEEILASGGADVIQLGRQTLADPDFVIKARLGRDADINKCMRCMSCFSMTGATRNFHCAINPEIGHELEYRSTPPVQVKKKVLVVGGGIGGMQAALTLRRRGHEVILCERGDRLGGILLCEDQVPFKKRLREYLARQARYCAQEGVQIRLNTTVTPEYVLAEKPDVLIAALGAEAVKPPIPGMDGAQVFAAEKIYVQPQQAGQRVVILGGGLVGLELALFLKGLGRDVTVIEMMPAPNVDLNSPHGQGLSKELRLREIPIRVSTRAQRIEADGVAVTGPAGDEFLPADTVVYAAGMRPRQAEAIALSCCAPEFYLLGDCVAAKNILSATQPADAIAREIGRM